MITADLEPGLEEVRQLLRAHLASGRAFGACPAEVETLIDVFLSKTVRYSLNSDHTVDRWIKDRLRSRSLYSEIVPLASLESWRIDEETGDISHDSGRFFTILGVTVRHRAGNRERVWDQPGIDQPEIGILGILARRFNGVLHFCLQAKEEPGNINSVQLSPTVQATYSNYTQAHGGKLPPFVEYFLDPRPEQVLIAKLQTEDGGRFLFKSNRNMIVLVDDDITLPASFIWLTLRQIGELMKRDNLVNACTRSVLAALV